MSTKIYKLIPLLFGLMFIFVFNVDKVSAQDYCGGGFSCQTTGGCEIQNEDGDMACSGSWVVTSTYCSAGTCTVNYMCNSSCTVQGTTIVGGSCIGNFCQYNTGSASCNVVRPSCGYYESYPDGSPAPDPNTGGTSGGTLSTCSDPNIKPQINNAWGSNFSVSQGDIGWVGVQYRSVDSTTMGVGVSSCPAGATCNSPTPINNDGGGPYTNVGVNIANTASLAPGTYPITINLTNTSNTSCVGEATVYLTVEPGRQTVCDNNWYNITGSFTAFQTPVGKYFSSPATINVFAPNASTGRNVYEQVCTGASAGQSCSWNSLPGWNNIGLFSSVVDQPIHIPSTNFRNAVVSTQSHGMFRLSGSSWLVFPPPAPVWGTPAPIADPFGRTYTFRRASGTNIAQYRCTVLRPDLNVNTLQTIGVLAAGTNLGFRGTVVNSGTAATTVGTQNRLRIDIGNDDVWDVTVSPNQSTGLLAINSSEIETWASAWVATAGTHKFEICADTTSVVTETNESNCFNSGTFTVAALGQVDLTVDSPVVILPPSTPGTSMDFRGTVRNPGTASAGATSSARLRIDQNSDGSWINIGNRVTNDLAPGGSHLLSWSNVWTAPAGTNTHLVEVCADVGLVITESNEGNNCTITSFTTAPAPNYALNVIKSGQGTVTSSPVGINCGADCTEMYIPNTDVVLTAVSASGRIFTGWTGCDSSTRNPDGSGGTCNIQVNSPIETVIANFAVDPNYREF